MCFSRAPPEMYNLQGVAREENDMFVIARHLVDFEQVTPNMHRVPLVRAMEVSSHLVTAEAGEDLRMNILSFCREQPGHIVIQSATGTGTLSSVTIEDPTMAGMTRTYEGEFSLLSISGVLMPLVVGVVGEEDRPGGINVIFGHQDGQLIGGRVAGPLIAASPLQVVVLITDPENAD